MIRKLTVRNFKRFAEETFEFPGHVVLAGPNNMGKTTVLQALSAWQFAFKHWASWGQLALFGGQGYRRRELSRADFSTVPLRTFEMLWHNRDHSGGRTIEIEVHHSDKWKITMVFEWDTAEQLYVRPRKDSTGVDFLLAELAGPKLVHVPAGTAVLRDEAVQTPAYVDLMIGLGKPGDVLRNLLVVAHQNGEAWTKLTGVVRDLFGYELLPPNATGAYIRAEYAHQLNGPSYDISSAGSGFQQILVLFGFLFSRPGSILLIDEPDAHLHVLLQDVVWGKLRTLAAQTNSQLIVATHSEVFINSVDPEQLCVILNRPRFLATTVERERLAESLRVLTNVDIMSAQQGRGVLYVEDFTDIEMLRAWAAALSHPIKDFLAKEVLWRKVSFTNRDGGEGFNSREHFAALQLVHGDLPAVELIDGDANPGMQSGAITGHGLQRLRWRRYESESYLVHPAALARFLTVKVGGGALAAQAVSGLREGFLKLFGSGEMVDAFYANPLTPTMLVDSLLNTTKARTRILPPLLTSGGLPGYPYQQFHEIARLMKPDEVHPEVREKLDAIKTALRL